jgi:predicted nucleic acid-binding protein
MMCVDASVVAKWFLPEELADRARALLRDALNANEPIVAPPLLPYEVTNILRQRLRASTPLPLEHALVHLDDFLNVPIELRSPLGLHRHALILADAYGLPAVYDAHYLALAEHLECVLWTDDRRLLRLVGDRLPFVRAIGDYQLPA